MKNPIPHIRFSPKSSKRLVQAYALAYVSLASLASADELQLRPAQGGFSFTPTGGSTETVLDTSIEFNGVTIREGDLLDGIKEYHVDGDLVMNSGDRIFVEGYSTGEHGVRLYVSNDVNVAEGASIDVSAYGRRSGGGGGNGGLEISSTGKTDYNNGGDRHTNLGASRSPGGSNERAGSDGTTGSSSLGNPGADGEDGSDAIPAHDGGDGLNAVGSGGAGGMTGAGGKGGRGAPAAGSTELGGEGGRGGEAGSGNTLKSVGGEGGSPGKDGKDGLDGSDGGPGWRGQDGDDGQGGLHLYTADNAYLLVGGGGGASGGIGGRGGQGGGGASGQGGGGGGSAGGGGAGENGTQAKHVGGAGGSGGSGGDGGAGGEGGRGGKGGRHGEAGEGGGGGGVIEIIAQGVILLDGEILANGSDGTPGAEGSDGEMGDLGEIGDVEAEGLGGSRGGDGESGESTSWSNGLFTKTASGGSFDRSNGKGFSGEDAPTLKAGGAGGGGGRGGRGGRGGNGGAGGKGGHGGHGGHGGGGSGGTISLIASTIKGSGELNAGKGHGSKVIGNHGEDGKILLSQSGQSATSPTIVRAQYVLEPDGPTTSNPFLLGVDDQTPSIPGLPNGPEAYGLASEVVISDSFFTSSAPEESGGVIIRLDASSPYVTGLDALDIDYTGFDWVLFYNHTDKDITAPQWGFDGEIGQLEALRTGGYLIEEAAGEEGATEEITTLAPGEVFLTLIPETVTSISYSSNGYSRYSNAFENGDILYVTGVNIDVESLSFDTSLNIWQLAVSGLDPGQSYHLTQSADCQTYEARSGSEFVAASDSETLLVAMDSSLERAFLQITQGKIPAEEE